MPAITYRGLAAAVVFTLFIGAGTVALAADDEPALPRLQELSTQGDAKAQYQLAQHYRKGDGVQKDFNRAMQLIVKSAQQGYAPAQYQMGIVYLIGKEVKKDLTQAVKWLDKAARQDDPSAQYVLGTVYIQQMRDTHLEDGVKLIQKAAPKDPRALSTLGVLTLNGIGVEKDPPAAFEMFKSAAKAGWAEAASYGAIMMIDGVGTKKNVEYGMQILISTARQGESTAIRYFMSEARNGHSQAQVLMAECLMGGCQGVDKDIPEAKKWLNKAATQGNSDAMLYLGDIASSEKNTEQALHWYKAAAKAGNKDAAMRLAKVYGDGTLVKRDPGESTRWYGRAADAGDSDAKRHMLSLFSETALEENGKAVTSAALEWLRRRADQGDVEAQAKLGHILMWGYGTPKDATAAVGWLKKAAMHGNQAAQSALRNAYLHGEGVPRDRVRALAWWMVVKNQDIDSLNSFARSHDSLETQQEADQLARQLRKQIAANGG